MILRHRFEPADNRRLARLCGPLDAHLRQIEQALDVRIERREAAFAIHGSRVAVHVARNLLITLHDSTARTLDERTVRLALVEAGATDAATAPKPGARGVAKAAAKVEAKVEAATDDTPIHLHTRHSDLAGRTPNQVAYLRHILARDICFGIGPAGTGKTFLAVACAVDALERGTVQRIVLTRPAVEAGEKLGFLPGDLAQKVDPYLRPLYDALYDLMGFERVGRAFEKGQLEIAPLAFMRGRTLNHAFVILDEAQNSTREQMKMFLTRIGFGSKCVITGDVSQIDLPKGQSSGLVDAEQVLQNVEGVGFTRFGADDVVRHPLVARIVRAYDKAAERERRRSTARGDDGQA
ncbi:PhoH family protein [Rubrivivax albus]|uniref:PhoH-like protein n=1 Tax=Rubrivivax albus TaxID=2499835 RepID=A0A3S2TMM1_9BURK|nr:PhoH family protein [Rubrivivax albus]RVT51417.1 PhoH family protein [Rubrivivax albus]